VDALCLRLSRSLRSGMDEEGGKPIQLKKKNPVWNPARTGTGPLRLRCRDPWRGEEARKNVRVVPEVWMG